MAKRTPVVLCFSGHDPSGGAGVQADIEAIAAQGAHAATVVTALTVQDSRDVQQVYATAPDLIRAQAELLFADLQPMAIKIGLIGDADNARVLADLLSEHPQLPVVLDPVLRAGGGGELATDNLIEALQRELMPRCTVLTPNADEARRLTGRQALADCAAALLASGARQVLITGGDEATPKVENRLYGPGGAVTDWDWPRLPHQYHGSGCTLAAALAARLALGENVVTAAATAQQYVAQCLRDARHLGRGQWFPKRL
ncbi:MAG: bifunctional hydroxymethylpyrimidine kinase/phosphomethylpyrimidine kinase [Nevskiales bacterium]